MRPVVAGLSGLLVAAAVWLALIVLVWFIGGTECDRGQCNFLGEFADEQPAALIVTTSLFALGAGVIAASFLSRVRRR